MERANLLYDGAGCGVQIDASGPTRDVSVNIDADLTHACADRFKPLAALVASAGTGNQLNIFAGAAISTAGEWCPAFPRILAVATHEDPLTIAHELGHSLSLDDEETNSPRNIMASGQPGRNFVTLGQCFKANVMKRSIARDFRAVPLDERACPTGCPDLVGQYCQVSAPIVLTRNQTGPVAGKCGDVEGAVRKWQRADDASRDQQLSMLTTMRCDTDRSTTLLLAGFTDGPGADEIRDVRVAAQESWDVLSASRRQTGRPDRLTPLEPYLARYEANYRAMFQVKAASAFRLLPSPRGLTFLQQVRAQDPALGRYRVDVRREIISALQR